MRFDRPPDVMRDGFDDVTGSAVLLRMLSWLTAILLLCGSASAAPKAAPHDPVKTVVVLTPWRYGVSARYSLSAPVSRFRFDSSIADLRKEGWEIEGDQVWDGDTIVSKDGKPFRRFQIRVSPDVRQRDRIYPALTRIGPEGYMIFEPHFAAHPDQGPTTVKIMTPIGSTTLPAGVRPKPDESGYVYFGPTAYVTGGGKVVSAPTVPVWLSKAVQADSEAATTFFQRRLGVPLSTPPLMVMSLYDGPSRDFRGDVTEGQVVSLRLYGKAWAEPQAGSTTRVGLFTAHEYFHFWNGGLYRSTEMGRAPWLHEGAAEYAARLSAMDSGHLDDAGMARSLGISLSGCAGALGDKGLRADPPKRGSAVYDCGVVAQWIADLRTRSASGGKRDVLDIWRRIFADNAATKTYDTAAFVAAVGSSPLTLLLEPGKDRWPTLIEALAPLGATVVRTRSDDLDRRDLFFHLLKQACTGDSYGFYGEAAGVKLDSGDRCGPLSGDLFVDAVEGRSVMTEAAAAFDAVQAACAAGRTVTLVGRGKVVATMTCARPLGPPSPAWTVEKWR